VGFVTSFFTIRDGWYCPFQSPSNRSRQSYKYNSGFYYTACSLLSHYENSALTHHWRGYRITLMTHHPSYSTYFAKFSFLYLQHHTTLTN
jgi:hypothetical protein